jgi:hypothetical protein
MEANKINYDTILTYSLFLKKLAKNIVSFIMSVIIYYVKNNNFEVKHDVL